MRWLEIIELRSIERDRALLEIDLPNLMAEVDQEVKPQGFKLYKHGTLETDLSIHLLYDCEVTNIRKSPLGLRLASALGEFGLVNHTLWFEKYSSI